MEAAAATLAEVSGDPSPPPSDGPLTPDGGMCKDLVFSTFFMSVLLLKDLYSSV